SNQNNQNLYFWGGTASYTQNSADNLLRDAQWHRAMDIYPGHVVYGTKTESYAQFTDIFDSTKPDPSCTAQTSTF
ncbi:MAG: hypothetical protein ACRDPG_06855, partial [Nocardioidaceae bacterium]